MFRSLRGKFLAACLGPLFVLGLAMGAAGIYALLAATDADLTATVVQLVTIFVWCLLVAGFATLVLTTRITQSLTELMDAAREVAKGNLDVSIDTRADDEVGALARIFQKTVRSLRETRARMERMTYHDGLTGICNRLGTDRMLALWHEEAAGRPAALVSLDIDDFKFINDLLGHEAGDDALRALAQRLQAFFGDAAGVGRQGGDEFLVLLPDTTPAQAMELLLHFTERPQAYTHAGVRRRFTVSMGFATYPDQAKDVPALMRAADAALYATKLRGKNGFSRYVASQEPVDRARLSFRLRDISENLPGAILVYKVADGRILYANDEAVRLFACESRDGFLAFAGGTFPQLIDTADRVRALAEIRGQSVTAADHKAAVRYRIRTETGETRRVRDLSRLKSSAFYGAVYYTVLVEEKEER